MLTYAADVEPQAWDIHSSGADVVAFLQRNVFDSLVAQQPDGTFVPWLATSWEVSADSTSYEFALREDVTFHDGEKFDAEAVKANFDHIVDPDTASQYAAGLLGPYESTEVVDEYTVRVNFSAPFAAFLQAASTAYLGFYSPAALAAPDTLDTAEAAVGTGPFTLERYAKGQEVRYAKNPDYAWAPENAEHDGAAYLDEPRLPVHPGEQRAAGRPDERAGRCRGSHPAGQRGAGGGRRQPRASPAPTRPACRTPCSSTPAGPRSTTSGCGRPSSGPWTSTRSSPPSTSTSTSAPGARSARRPPGCTTRRWRTAWSTTSTPPTSLLDEAGWSERNSDGTRTRDGEEPRARLAGRPEPARAAGPPRPEPAGRARRGRHRPGHPVGRPRHVRQPVDGRGLRRRGLVFVRPEGDILRLHFHSDNIPIQNAAALSDPEIDALLEEALSTTDEAVRADLYGQVQERVVEDAVTIPVYVPSSLVATQTYVQGLRRDPSGWPLFYDAWTNGQ